MTIGANQIAFCDLVKNRLTCPARKKLRDASPFVSPWQIVPSHRVMENFAAVRARPTALQIRIPNPKLRGTRILHSIDPLAVFL